MTEFLTGALCGGVTVFFAMILTIAAAKSDDEEGD